MFYASPTNLIAPGFAQVMGEGWETARRRDDDNDWISVQLAAQGVVRMAELDTSHFKGNAPGWASLSGRVGDDWVELLPRTRLQPDTRHRFRLHGPAVTHVRMDIYPDGGMARLRLHGALTEAGQTDLVCRWLNTLPAVQATSALVEAGLSEPDAAELVAKRPFTEIPAAQDAHM
jgi:allantoicase